MGLFTKNYSKPGKGVEKDEQQKRPFFLFFELFFAKFWKMIQLNLLYLLFWIPAIAASALPTASARPASSVGSGTAGSAGSCSVIGERTLVVGMPPLVYSFRPPSRESAVRICPPGQPPRAGGSASR